TKTNTEETMRKRSPKRRISGALAIAMAALFALPAVAHADLLKDFTAEVRDQNGNPYTQAGGHPYEAFTDINFFQHDVNGQPIPDESVKTIQVDLPPGLVGNPQNIPMCSRQQINQGFGGCPDNTQVGL